jgi:CubicO group peptidase (beta-lactamase class C family)
MCKNLILLFFIFGLSSCDQPEKTNYELDRVRSIINEFERKLIADIEQDNVGGSISASIVLKDKIIWSNAFGISQTSTNQQANTNIIYRIGSITKSFTAYLMMQMVEEGIITLDEPIENYLPEVRNIIGYSDTTTITFRNLANHTSGLIMEPILDGIKNGPVLEWEKLLLIALPRTSFKNQPGAKFSYSNIGYCILGLALSRAADKPYTQLIEEKIFTPLSMNNSYFVVPQNKIKNLAEGINGGPGEDLDFEKPVEGHAGRGYRVPSGGIYSTPKDLAVFMLSNLENTLLTKNGLNLMQTNSMEVNTWTSMDYGIGFYISRNDTIKFVEHHGFVYGYTASFTFSRTSGYGIIIVRNYNHGATNLREISHEFISRLSNLN